MTREPYSDPSQWHDLARLVLNDRLESATRTLYCEDRDRRLRARYHPLESMLVLEESADDHLFGWHPVAVYEGPDLPDIVRGDRETFTAALETYDRGERTRERIKPDIEFADIDVHAHLQRCESCGFAEVVPLEEGFRDCCDSPERRKSPLIDRNQAVDIAAAPFKSKLEALDDGPARDEVLELYETLFPPWEEREVSDGGD